MKRKALLSAFLRRIDVLVDSGRYPNPSGLSLRGIIVEGLFVEDMPEIEIWSSTGPIYNSNSSSRYTSWDYDEATAVYDVNRDIVGDFAIVVRLGESDIEDDGSVSSSKRSSLHDDDSLVLFRYVTSTGFLKEGTHDIKMTMLSIPDPSDSQFFDENNFKLTLTLKRSNLIKHSVADAKTTTTIHSCEAATLPGADQLAKFHSIVPDDVLFQRLRAKFVSIIDSGLKLALSLGANDYQQALSIIEDQGLEKNLTKFDSSREDEKKPVAPEEVAHVKTEDFFSTTPTAALVKERNLYRRK